MRARRAGAERRIEVDVEPRVQFEIVALHAGHMHDVIALRVHLAERVLVKEVIAHHQAAFVFREPQIVRPGTGPEIQRKTLGLAGSEISNMTTLPA